MRSTLVILPTGSCNFDCSFCVFKDGNGGEIDLKSLKDRLSEAYNLGYRNVILTGGGEPSLNFEKLMDIIRHCKNRGFERIKLVTNGSFYDGKKKSAKNIDEILSYLTHISISFDAEHLKYSSFSNYVSLVKKSLKRKLKTHLTVVHTDYDRDENMDLIKKLAKEMGANLRKPVLRNIFRRISPHSYNSFFEMKNGDGKVMVWVRRAIPSESTRNLIKADKSKPEKFVFEPCVICPILKFDNSLIPCLNSINSKKPYSLADLKENSFDEMERRLRSSNFNRFSSFLGFARFYSRFSRRGWFPKFSEKEFYRKCDVCQGISKLADEKDGKTDYLFLAKLVIRNFPEFLKISVYSVLSRIYFKFSENEFGFV